MIPTALISSRKKFKSQTTMRLPTSRSLLNAAVGEASDVPGGAAVPTRNVPDFPVINHIVTIHHTWCLDAFQSIQEPQSLYIRQAVVDAFAIYRGANRLVEVLGPPGCGKSVSLYLFLMDEVSRNNNTLACWFSVGSNQHAYIEQRRGTCTVKEIEFVFGPSTTFLEFVELFEFNMPNYIVFDALETFTDKSNLNMIIKLCLVNNCRVYTCSSMGATLDGRVYAPATGAWTSTTFEFGPWLYSDYQAMTADAEFFRSVKRNLLDDVHAESFELNLNFPVDLTTWNNMMSTNAANDNTWNEDQIEYALKIKFQLAGFNCRWMFAFSYNAALTSIKRFMRQSARIGDIINGNGLDMNNTSRNHLRCTFVVSPDIDRHWLVSEYVCRALMDTVDMSFIIRAKNDFANMVTANPLLNGVVLEIDVIYHLKSNSLSGRVQLLDRTTNTLGAVEVSRYHVERHITMHSVHEWSGIEALFNNPVAAATTNGVAFYPTIFDCDGFDFVVVRWENGQLVAEFVQVARASTLKLKLSFLRAFVNKFNSDPARVVADHVIRQVQVTFMCPSNSVNTFTITEDNVSGALAYGYSFANIQVAAFSR